MPSAVKSSGTLTPASSNSGAFSVGEILFFGSFGLNFLVAGEVGDWRAPPGVLLPHGVCGAGHGLHKQGPCMLLPRPQCWRAGWSQ